MGIFAGGYVWVWWGFCLLCADVLKGNRRRVMSGCQGVRVSGESGRQGVMVSALS
jgi:hypothetical protein